MRLNTISSKKGSITRKKKELEEELVRGWERLVVEVIKDRNLEVEKKLAEHLKEDKLLCIEDRLSLVFFREKRS